jgi:tRNA G18 (ribose-2'-O)-methylase SpoU
VLVAAEETTESEDLTSFTKSPLAPLIKGGSAKGYAIVMGNEVRGVLPETLSYVDHIVHIPMLGIKDSLNVGQAAAIMMWELSK